MIPIVSLILIVSDKGIFDKDYRNEIQETFRRIKRPFPGQAVRRIIKVGFFRPEYARPCLFPPMLGFTR